MREGAIRERKGREERKGRRRKGEEGREGEKFASWLLGGWTPLVLQVVESHRKQFPDMRKSTVIHGLQSSDNSIAT